MTKAQITDLLARSNQACYEGEGINVTPADVIRLLAERERLLDALRAAKKALRFVHGQYTCAEGAVDDAIDFAEETA